MAFAITPRYLLGEFVFLSLHLWGLWVWWSQF